MGRRRIVKQHDVRRTEILDCAERLFYADGYAAATVQAIIDSLGVAKGTFYHYFASKEELLEALAERTGFRAVEQVHEEVERTGGSALDRLNRFFALTDQWKRAARDTYVAMVRSLYDERNLLFRRRLEENGVAFLAPILGEYIERGVREGVFRPFDSGIVAEWILRFRGAMGERTMPLIFELPGHPERLPEIVRHLRMYQDTIERLLGIASGTISVFDEAEFERTFAAQSGEKEKI